MRCLVYASNARAYGCVCVCPCVRHPVRAKQLFAREREGIYAQGRAEGLAAGRVEGLTQGRAEGLAQGRAEGLAQGRAEGLAQGRADGLATGRAEGQSAGIVTGLRHGGARLVANVTEKGSENRDFSWISSELCAAWDRPMSMFTAAEAPSRLGPQTDGSFCALPQFFCSVR